MGSFMQRTFLLIGLTVLAMHTAGCGPSGPQTYPVTGTVTFKGEPVPEGEILLTPIEGDYGPEPGKIREGKFELRARAGQKRVEIRASRIIPGGALGAMGEPVAEDYIPGHYNWQSTLTAEVSADDENHFVFELTDDEN